MDIKAGFDEVATRYDEQRKKILPCFDDFYSLPVSLADVGTQQPRVLDLGAGTGIFSAFLLERFPEAHITLADLSEGMLDVAKERFAGNKNVEYLLCDYTEYDFSGGYDIIISALSIHHIPVEKKEKLYHKCYGLLKKGGVMINADIVLAPTPFVNRLFLERHNASVDRCGLSREEIQKGRERMKFDDPSTLEDQLRWMREAGFAEAACVYQHLHLAVMMAWK